MSNTLYGGDRAGSRYYYVLENTAATETAQKDSGLHQPRLQEQGHGVSDEPVREVPRAGAVRRARAGEGTRRRPKPTDRTWNQYAVDTVYRFLPDEQLFVGARYNKAHGELAGITGDVGANRWQFGGGWFITAERAGEGRVRRTRSTSAIPTTNIKNGGQFNGHDARRRGRLLAIGDGRSRCSPRSRI